jgi:hypothetical protein
VPGTITVTPTFARATVARPADGLVDFDIRLEYRGGAVVGPRGERVSAGSPYAFGYSRFFVPMDWHVRYYTFDEASRPDKAPDAFARVLAGAPVKAETRDRLDYMAGGAIVAGLPRDRVAIVAEAEVALPPGQYTLRTISDDGVRVWMDDQRIIDRWTPHESAIDTAPVSGGRRRLKVEYYEIGGFAELRFEILRR